MEKDQEGRSAIDYSIHSVQTALRILGLFIPRNEPLALMEISRQLALNKSTALRMTATLTGAGYLKIHPESRKYLLGTTALQLGLSAYDTLNLHKVSEPIISQLADSTNCVVHLCSNERDTVVVIDKVYPMHKAFSVPGSQIGGIIPTYCTGIGLLFLSQENDLFIRGYLEGSDRIRYTETTVTDIDAIMARIQQIRADDFCVNNGEHEAGVVSIAYPIRDHARRIVAGISIGAIREVMHGMDLAALHEQVRAAAQEISRQLGG